MMVFEFIFWLVSLIQWAEFSKSSLTKLSRVIKSSIFVEFVYLIHILHIKTEINNIRVLFHSFWFDTFWNHSYSLLNNPSQNNLMWRFFMFFSNFNNYFIFVTWFIIILFGKSNLKIWTCTKTWVTCHLNTFLSCISDQFFLIHLGMDFILKYLWLYLTIVNYLPNKRYRKIA